jgi:glycosyltransferase involved in cell wall biosynthesis
LLDIPLNPVLSYRIFQYLQSEQPTRLDAALFSVKAAVLRGIRFVSNVTQPVRRLEHGAQSDFPALLAECTSPLWMAESTVENSLQLGKVQNLRKACARLHLLELQAGELFSFWKQIGRARKSAGYARGRELRQGCLIPSVGGGLCQLSNALYDVALKSGCEIVERHAHSAVVPGSAAEQGRDATIFWNYVDLRFRTQQDVLLTALLSKDELVVSFWGKQGLVSIGEHKPQLRKSKRVNTCTDCGVTKCFRHVEPEASKPAGHGAFLIEECWPEFEEYAGRLKSDRDELFLPFHSNLRKISRYKWDSIGYTKIIAANIHTVLSSTKERFGLAGNLPPVAIQVSRSKTLADYYSERLSAGVSYLHIAQSLLPFLWRRGDLGGRGFSVLMTRTPLRVLHKKLDDLVARFPKRKTFQEFRAPDWMVEAEAEALERADEIVTPHALLAGLYPHKTTKLKWKVPHVDQNPSGACIVFPGPALARKGAFELREAVAGSDRKLVVLNGKIVESGNFWDGMNVVNAGRDWLRDAAVVVQAAFIENAPRPLLRALAAGVPVIATPECGIEAHPQLTLVPAGEVAALESALTTVLGRRDSRVSAV